MRITTASTHVLVARIRHGPNYLRARKYMCVSWSMGVCLHLVNIVLSIKGRDASVQPQPCRNQLQFYFGHFFCKFDNLGERNCAPLKIIIRFPERLQLFVFIVQTMTIIALPFTGVYIEKTFSLGGCHE